MSDKRDGPRLDATRRRFLQAAGLAAASVPLGVAGEAPAGAAPSLRRVGPPVRGETDDCGCGAHPALPLQAAALFRGGYVGLATSESGPRLFTVDVDGSGRVSLGPALAVNLPEGFVAGSVGIGRGELVLTGGLPFVWETVQAQSGIDGVPGARTEAFMVMGLRPAAFRVDPPHAEPLALPELPRRLFAVTTQVAETSEGALVVLLEHSDDLTESWYAAGVDVLEQTASGWAVRTAGRDLGESGPNHLAVQGNEVVVALKTSEGVTFVRPGRTARAAGPPGISRVLGFVGGEAALTLLAADRAGAVRKWSRVNGSWAGGSAVHLAADDVVGALPVSGARGQSILLGQRETLLVDESSALGGPQAGR